MIAMVQSMKMLIARNQRYVSKVHAGDRVLPVSVQAALFVVMDTAWILVSTSDASLVSSVPRERAQIHAKVSHARQTKSVRMVNAAPSIAIERGVPITKFVALRIASTTLALT